VEPAPAPVPEPVVTTPVREQPNDEVRRLETFLESIVAEQRRRGAPSA
jgi:hypothetical protein